MVGQNIGKYRVLDRVGRGGMGTVYRALDETLHREVAIKVLNAELNDPEIAKRFRAEAITVARLSHPGIATIYELFQHDGQWLMVMEFVRGETLEHMVDRMGALSPQRSAELCMQSLAALAHAHSMGVVHRDLKPANVMITETGAVKIMDFGIARVAGTEHLTNAGFMMGTPAYMSPEQVRGEEIDARADLYAMGVVFYRLTTGKLPFKGETPFAMAQSQVNDPPTPVGLIRSDLPPWVELVIVRALAKRPEERFQSAAEFHEAFARCLAGLPLTTVYGATAYGSTAQTEILATPPRPLPTGSLSMRGPGTGGVGMPSGPVPAPATTSAAAGVAGTPIAGTPIAGAPTAAQPAAAANAAAGATATAPAKPVQKKEKSAAALTVAAIAAMIVIGGIVGAVWYRSRQAAAPPPPEPVTEPTSAPSSPVTVPPPDPLPPPATPPDPAAATAGAPATPGAPGSTAGAKSASGPTTPPPSRGAPGQPDPASSTQPGVKGAGRGTTPATPPGTAVTTPAVVPPPAAPGPPETLVAFNNVKLYEVSGKRSNDRDVLLNFAGGQISVLPKDGGEAISTLPYRSITKATYVKARDPKWDTSLLSPPEGLDVGSVFRQSRHWLVLQLPDRFAILRLEDNNFARILEAFEARTGLRLDRPQSNEK